MYIPSTPLGKDRPDRAMAEGSVANLSRIHVAVTGCVRFSTQRENRCEHAFNTGNMSALYNASGNQKAGSFCIGCALLAG